MTIGLPVSQFIDVSVSLTPPGAQFANFDSLLILGDSTVIDVHQRIRSYSSLTGVATDFGTTAPEYLAARDYFDQAPSPTTLYIGRWAKNDTHGLLVCGVLTSAQQAIGLWQAITNGGFKIAVDGAGPVEVDSLNFSAQTNLNGVAAIIGAALVSNAVAATCTWNGTQFLFKSNSTGTSSSVSALTAATAGGVTDVSAMLRGTSGTLSYTVSGILAESALACVTLFDQNITTQWYGLMFAAGAADVDISDSDHLAVAGYIEASALSPHLYGLTTGETAALSSTDTTSIGYLLKQAGYQRTFYQWSSTDPYAVAALFGIMFTVDFEAANTTITLMFQSEAGETGEVLTATQANALNASNYNYFAALNNGTSIVVNGQVASGNFVDTVWGIDWLANEMQTNIFNLMSTIGTKVPQTDDGNHLIATQIEAACDQGVRNGLLAPGTWNAGGFGQIKTGQFLPLGYYIYTPPIDTQAQSDRAARKSVSFQVAAKMAGAVQSVDVLVNVNP